MRRVCVGSGWGEAYRGSGGHPRLRRWLSLLAAATACTALTAGSARAASLEEFSEFPTPTGESAPTDLTLGAEGNIWFTEFGSGVHLSSAPVPGKSRIGEINPRNPTERHDYETKQNSQSGPFEITTGAEGNLWFTAFNEGTIGELNPSKPTEIHEFAISLEIPPSITGEKLHPFGIALGPEGKIWFTINETTKGATSAGLSFIGFIDPTTHSTKVFETPTPTSFPGGITPGPEGNIWFTEGHANRIGVFNPGTKTFGKGVELTSPGPHAPAEITLGHEGNLWFTDLFANEIGEINPAKQELIEEIPIPTTKSGEEVAPLGITTGREGDLWFTEHGRNMIARLNPATKKITQLPAGSSAGLAGLQADREGSLWYAANESSEIGVRGAGPTTVTDAATAISESSATLNATVDPNEVEVESCKFEYGTTTSYTASVPCSSKPGSGTTPVAVSAALTGLRANTTYHFRILAATLGGRGEGADETFRTAATCGKTSVGGHSDHYVANRKRVNKCELPTAAKVSKLSVYLAKTSSAGQQLIRGVIYADSHGVPGVLRGETEQLVFKSTGAAGWYRLAFAKPVELPPGQYWIGTLSGATGGVAGYRYDSVARARDFNTNAYSAGPSNPFGSFTQDSQQMSLYATYTTG